MGVYIKQIEYYLPQNVVTNQDIQISHPNWDISKVSEKSGVFSRHIAAKDETAYDLASKAVAKLFEMKSIEKCEIDGIIFCTQSPDYIMPSNAFLIHKQFNFESKVWAFDYNLACSGYVFGLTIARGMIETGMGENILLINSDTYSKYINKDDRSTSVLFGDGAAVSIISRTNNLGIIDIALSSSGKDFDSFYIPSGGCRLPKSDFTSINVEEQGMNIKTLENIHMNGFAVWKFISTTVPMQINTLLTRNKLKISDIDFFGFHQASKLTLDSLMKSLKIDSDKVFLNLDKIGNTVSASIPIVLKEAEQIGKLKRGDLVLISGFGVGLSWGSLLMKY